MDVVTMRIATSAHYDHTSDLVSGRVSIKGIQPKWLSLPLLQVFNRRAEWDLCEASLAKFCQLVSEGDESITAIPVFPSRIFRHSAFYVRKESPITELASLAGARIGIPDWSQTAVVYARGLLTSEYGVDLAGIDWIQGGLDEPARNEFMWVPEGFTGSIRGDISLTAMLYDGEIDAIIAARSPLPRSNGQSARRILENSYAIERDYFERTSIFPIMHSIVIKKEFASDHPWAIGALLNAFSEARDASLSRMQAAGTSHVPVPWIADDMRERVAFFDGNVWPYGIEENRVTLQAFIDYATAQGMCSRALAPEDLFIDESYARL